MKVWLKEFLKRELNTEGNITQVRISGKVLIAKLNTEEEKREIMKKKNRLKGGSIFIENDLSWEERKVQERINTWAKLQRGKGKDIKI